MWWKRLCCEVEWIYVKLPARFWRIMVKYQIISPPVVHWESVVSNRNAILPIGNCQHMTQSRPSLRKGPPSPLRSVAAAKLSNWSIDLRSRGKIFAPLRRIETFSSWTVVLILGRLVINRTCTKPSCQEMRVSGVRPFLTIPHIHLYTTI